MSSESGLTLVELVVVVAIVSLIVTMTLVSAIPIIARETMHGAMADVRAFMQLTKIEAVSRNHDCGFVVDSSARTLGVWDSMGTSSTSDDELLHDGAIGESVTFARPDSGATVTLSQIGSTTSYETIFSADGAVSSGTGSVHLFGGEAFGRVSVLAAGGLETALWKASAWVAGS